MKCLWLTDIHLNFLDADERAHYYQMLKAQNSDCILLTGDIAEAPCVCKILKEMAEQLQQTIYFVLGNHDYYGGEVVAVQQAIQDLTLHHPQLYWCQSADQKLSETTCIVGCDGWADGRYGDYFNSPVRLNDSRMIAELFQADCLSRSELLSTMQQLADRDAAILQQQIEHAAASDCQKIVVLTHIPPFPQAALHEGKPQDDDFLPYFTCKATGDVINSAAQTYQDINFLVLCGHTHSQSYFQASENCLVRAGDAVYQSPSFIELLTL